jgi:hypothetical protein
MPPDVLDFQLLNKVSQPFGRIGCLFHALILAEAGAWRAADLREGI